MDARLGQLSLSAVAYASVGGVDDQTFEICERAEVVLSLVEILSRQ